jgi:hypothetical protein
MGFAAAGERGMKTDDAEGAPFFDPLGHLVTMPEAQPAEIDKAELGPSPLAQPRDALQNFHVVVKGRADKNADIEVGALGLPPIVEAVHEGFETREG